MSRVIWVRVGDIHPDMKGEEHHLLGVGVVRLLEHGPAGGQWLWSMTQVHPGPPLDVPRSDVGPQRALVECWRAWRAWYGVEED